MDSTKHKKSLIVLILMILPLISCNNTKKAAMADSCYLQLFDGDNFEDDNIVIKGSGEYADLNNLPNAHGQDWTDEADSFVVGDSTTVEVWNNKNFEGESTTYKTGKYNSVDKVYSLKISCVKDEQ